MSSQKNILFIVDHLKGGGAEIMSINLAKQLEQNGYRIHFLLLSNENNFSQLTSSFKLYQLNNLDNFISGKLLINKELDKENKTKLDQIIQEVSPDNIIITVWYAFLLLPYINHKSIINWLQADLLPSNNKILNIFKILKNQYRDKIYKRKFIELFSQRRIVTLNKDLQKKYSNLLNIDKEYIQVIPNGLPIPNQNNSNQIKFEKKWDICFVGRLTPSKQVDHAIIAFSKSNLRGRMVIVGEGKRRKKLEKLACKLNIQNRIDFIGWVDNSLDYIKQSKLLILPSLTEGYPLVIGESLINNTPVIAYNCCEGVESQLYTNDMKRGLVALNNIKGLIESIEDLIIDPYIIPENIHEKYSLDQMAKKFMKIMQ